MPGLGQNWEGKRISKKTKKRNQGNGTESVSSVVYPGLLYDDGEANGLKGKRGRGLLEKKQEVKIFLGGVFQGMKKESQCLKKITTAALGLRSDLKE